MRRLVLVAFIAVVLAPPAAASQPIDRDAVGVRLAVTRDGKTAVLTYPDRLCLEH